MPEERPRRYDQCDDTCTVDCGHCKGAGKPQPQTIGERLDAIEASGWPIAYDGCHKMYFLQDAEREEMARDGGYEIHPSTEIKDLWTGSCSLRFVNRWGYDNADFDHPLNIDQFEED